MIVSKILKSNLAECQMSKLDVDRYVQKLLNLGKFQHQYACYMKSLPYGFLLQLF